MEEPPQNLRTTLLTIPVDLFPLCCLSLLIEQLPLSLPINQLPPCFISPQNLLPKPLQDQLLQLPLSKYWMEPWQEPLPRCHPRLLPARLLFRWSGWLSPPRQRWGWRAGKILKFWRCHWRGVRWRWGGIYSYVSCRSNLLRRWRDRWVPRSVGRSCWVSPTLLFFDASEAGLELWDEGFILQEAE